ncbi:MAG: AI-2E family transporter [Actinomyces sp.]|nr:AI-2E family transporter [Actinomyces sp.]
MERIGTWSWRFVGICAALVILALGASRLRVVLVAAFLGLVLTAVLRPMVEFLRRHLPAPIAVALSLLTGALLVLALFCIAVVGISSQRDLVVRGTGEGIADLLRALREGGLPLTIADEDIEGWTVAGLAWLRANSWGLAGFAATQVGTVAVFGMVIAFGVFTSVCLLVGGDRMWSWFLDQVPLRTRRSWDVAGHAAWSFFGGYTRGAFSVAGMVGIIAWVVLRLLGVPLSTPLAILVFLGSFIPLIGAPAAMSLAILVALASNGVWSAVIVGVAIALVGQVEGNILEPLVMGRHAHLHPFAVGAAVTVGTVLGGLIGALVAVPVVGVSWYVFDALRGRDRALVQPPVQEAEGGARADVSVDVGADVGAEVANGGEGAHS